MYVNRIQNTGNICLNSRDKCPQFKGEVSPLFEKYVNTIRTDCLNTVPEHSHNLINNICDNIITKAQKVMRVCFPEDSFLSVYINKSGTQDSITYSNDVLKKYVSENYNAFYISKKEYATPIKRLMQLHRAIIKGYSFAGASVKDYVRMFYVVYYMIGFHLHDEQLAKDCKTIIEFYYNKINLIEAETNAKEYCELITPEQYTKLLSKIKTIE